MKKELKEIKTGDRIALINLIDEGLRQGSRDFPLVSDLFENLWELVNRTVSGAKINQIKAEESRNGFRVFQIVSEEGESLGRLNMLYLKKPISCYYLVYVEVAPPYRRKGLGNRILQEFRDFLIQKSSIGMLDNIIPEDDPTFDIYLKQGWEPIDSVLGDAVPEDCKNFMVFIPSKISKKDLRLPILKLIHHIRRRKTAIHMRDNEAMVGVTIEEFKGIQKALTTYFHKEIKSKKYPDLMRFMFTRYITKLISFKRRISELIGYTGGESLEQIVLGEEIKSIPIKTYPPVRISGKAEYVLGDKKLWLELPEELKSSPSGFIEQLPNYQRPRYLQFIRNGKTHNLTIEDLLSLGFDPTRLKEFHLRGMDYIFERIQLKQLPKIEKKIKIFKAIRPSINAMKINGTEILINPPLLVIKDRATAYVLRKKIKAIHWDEAIEQLRISNSLKFLNSQLNIERIINITVNNLTQNLSSILEMDEATVTDIFTFFISWDLNKNYPGLLIEHENTYLQSIWIA